MLKYYKYRIPFKKIFKTSIGDFAHREGIYLMYEENGIQAFGEVAPLPGFSIEKLSDVQIVLQQNKKYIEDALKSDTTRQVFQILSQIHNFPSLDFGLSTLVNDFKAKQKGVPLAEYLFEEYSREIECNGTIGLQDYELAIDNAKRIVGSGFKTLKVKVGDNFQNEKRILFAIRELFPELKIRIDANQNWNVQEAITNLNELSEIDIEYCEQPVSAQSNTDLKKVKEHTSIKIAADESIRNKEQAIELIQENCCDIMILKPALIGDFKSLFVTKEVADTHNIYTVITTSLDGIIGRITTAILVSGLNIDMYGHGLATGNLLNEVGVGSEKIEHGSYFLPQVNGIGSPIDLTYFEEML